MRNHFRILASELERELKSLERLNVELTPLLPAPQSPEPASASIRAIGSILHDFYGGIERIFRRIAEGMDGELPKGDDWHIELLQRMTSEIPGVRTAAISPALAEELDDFLRFRHLFRNVYGFQLRWAKFSALAKKMGPILQRFREEIEAFLKFLGALEKGMANKE